MIFCISAVSVIVSPLSFLVLFGSSVFSSCEPAQGFIDFVDPLRKPAVGLIDFFLLFFNLCYLFPLRSLLFPSIN